MAESLPDAARNSGNKPHHPVGCAVRLIAHAVTAVALGLTLSALFNDCVGLPAPADTWFQFIWCRWWIKYPAGAIDGCYLIWHFREVAVKATREGVRLWRSLTS